jgi:hypothetical protein
MSSSIIRSSVKNYKKGSDRGTEFVNGHACSRSRMGNGLGGGHGDGNSLYDCSIGVLKVRNEGFD